ncbi:AMP-binding protein [Pseudoroseomonas wenyumeiae]
MPLSLPDRIRAFWPEAEVVSLGGATEASIWSVAHPAGAPEPGWKSIPYGRPLANQAFHVLDGNLAPRPDWVPGELFIAGAGLAQGYWRDRERTEASFIRHPARGTAVPHRRPGPLPPGRHAGVPGPGGPPDQAAWPPHRVG